NLSMIFRILKYYVLVFKNTSNNIFILSLIICNITASLNFSYKFFKPKDFESSIFTSNSLKNNYFYSIFITLMIELVIKAMIYLYILVETFLPFYVILSLCVTAFLT